MVNDEMVEMVDEMVEMVDETDVIKKDLLLSFLSQSTMS